MIDWSMNIIICPRFVSLNPQVKGLEHCYIRYARTVVSIYAVIPATCSDQQFLKGQLPTGLSLSITKLGGRVGVASSPGFRLTARTQTNGDEAGWV